ncbi:MAG: helix-turn-helix domain-containing protein, partial [Bryobacteraceae bacterium]
PEARTRTLQVHIHRLREKLGPQRAQSVETIFGVGYRFQSFSQPPASTDLGRR